MNSPDFQKQFEKDVDAVLNGTYNSSNPLIIGKTPSVLQKIGLSELPLVLTPAHAYSIAKTEAQAKAEGKYQKGTNYHGLGADAVKQIYDKISDPIMVLAHPDFVARPQRANAHKIIIVVDLSVDNKQVIAPIEIDAEVFSHKKRIDVNLISTYFNRANFEKFIDEAKARENTGDIGFYYL
ncbi:hypothetical protein, partial [Yeguia hominis]